MLATGKGGAASAAHHGVMKGIANAEQLRDQIMIKIQRCRSAGLGDERMPNELAERQRTPSHGFSVADIELLKEIRDQTALLATRSN